MLSLPDVTLVMIETRRHDLARMAIEDCLRQADFGEALVFSDRRLAVQGATYVAIDDFPTKLGWCEFLWRDVPAYVKTRQALLIQWDSWIFDPAMWREDFLAFDYIGAPWWYRDGRNVGNSGFSLRSKRLMDFLAKREARFPVTTPAEDDLLCRRYRPAIEQETGFCWAPEDVALDFAFERIRAARDSRHFGFHGTFNWPFVLDADRLAERVAIAQRDPYIVNTGMLAEIAAVEAHPFPWRRPHWQQAA